MTTTTSQRPHTLACPDCAGPMEAIETEVYQWSASRPEYELDRQRCTSCGDIVFGLGGKFAGTAEDAVDGHGSEPEAFDPICGECGCALTPDGPCTFLDCVSWERPDADPMSKGGA